MSKNLLTIALALAGIFSSACQDPAEDPNIEPYRAQLAIGNGLYTNGLYTNGLYTNGLYTNGLYTNGLYTNGTSISALLSDGSIAKGISITSVTLNGIPVTGITANASQLSVKLLGQNITLSGTAVKGLTIQAAIPDMVTGKPTKIIYKIDSVTLDLSSRFKDIWLYQMSYKEDSANSWSSMCLDYANKPAPLFPISGSYWDEKTGKRVDDPNAFMLACYEGAVAKCAVAGYRPWASGSVCTGSGRSRRCTDVSLKDYHQACTRMLRADYCGDGTPHTVNGTLLDIFDYLNPPVQLQEEKWQMEARWNASGALCLSQRRHPEIPFPGCLRQTDKTKPATYVQLPKCQPYATGDDRGLIVSTFNSMTVQPGQ